MAESLSDIDKKAINQTVFTILNDTGKLLYINSEVDQNNVLNVRYLPNLDDNAPISALGAVIGAYYVISQNYPEISDLNITLGGKDIVGGGMYCNKSWIKDLFIDGKMDSDRADVVIQKVLETYEKG